jgi:hypothetical protein
MGSSSVVYFIHRIVTFLPTAGERRDKHIPEVSRQQEKDIRC